MPVPTNARYEQPLSPPSIMSTPSSRSSYLRAPTNNSSYSPTVTGGGQQKLNVVTKLAMEGRAKHGQDGASIRMFLKICIPVDAVSPGSTIPLFPEENVKIHTSQVHPLDQNSVPYNFSSTVSPLLHTAARALNLPPRSHENFNSAFNLAKSNGNSISSRSLKPENGELSVPPIDIQYTGHILVSGYSISFVLPKVFLSRQKDEEQSDTEEANPRTPSSRRRLSMGDRNQAQFMAAIDMWVPFLCKPPRFPYLLSIPTPRCLSNQIKLRIFPPVPTSSSFASLSSVEDDNSSWDLTSDPHVTRSVSTRRSHSYTHFADDESSDSSASNLTEGCVIQGSFPSAERIRIRWAKPTKVLNIPGDEGGRRRVGVEDVKGEMACTVRGKGKSASNPEIEGILMDVEFKGQCKGIWFPGVATLLGLDVSLQAKGSDVSWPQGHPTQWEVYGSDGYTGFDNGSSSTPPVISSRTSSLDSTGTRPLHPSSSSQTQLSTTYLTARTNSGSSMSSLLRAPLPVQNVADYSFEAANGALPSSPMGTMSSISSLPISSTPILPPINHPGSPITLHLNMNDLQPPAKSTFTFSISGTILLTPKATLSRLNGSASSISDKPSDHEPLVLPRFTVLAADSESAPIILRNEVDGASLEVFNPTGDISHDPQARKTVLQKNGFTRRSEDGTRISLKYMVTFNAFGPNGSARPISRPRTPSNNAMHRVSSNSPIPRIPFPSRNKWDGPAIIPWVKATVTTLAPDPNMFPTGYAVRLTLQTPSLLDSEWLDFGMALGPSSAQELRVNETLPRKVHIICASIDGVPVKSETTMVAKGDLDATAGAAPFEELGGKEWLCWGKVYAGTSVGGSMVIDYIVKEQDVISSKGRKWKGSSALNILLPTFFVSIGRLEVYVDVIPGLEVVSLHSNFDYHHALPEGNRLLRFSVAEFSQPHISLTIQKISNKDGVALPGLKWYFALTWSILLVAFCSIYRLMLDVRQNSKAGDGYLNPVDSWTDVPTVTITTTLDTNTGTHWWFGDSPAETRPPPTVVPMEMLTRTTSSIFSSTNIQPAATFTTLQPLDYTDDTQEDSLANTPPRSILEIYGLVPIENLFTFTWSDEHADALKRALEKVMGTMEVVWNIFRKVYHYPLDPP
ncbi:hypothetical protein GALMADRAFT_276442 [Galerina marginata CBS 339.88]|uniref:Uncharacterized protein n=1 Tax=Galerina marginata (strain CBS 339.88) TaxID=685588 RepID=A0A067TEZ9_GALM3|nr:hypothetical protein GALMADRAFT_276442 [Galerina marginata CBS 339.88]